MAGRITEQELHPLLISKINSDGKTNQEVIDARKGVDGSSFDTLVDHLHWIARNAQVRFEKYEVRAIVGANTNQVPINITGYSRGRDMLTAYQNTTFIKSGVDYVISNDSKYLIDISGTWVEGTVIDIIVLTTKESSPTDITIAEIQSTITVDSDQVTRVRIPLEQFNSITDNLSVHYDNLYLYKGSQWNIQDGSDYIDFTFPLKLGSTLHFSALKKVRSEVVGADGSIISDGTITNRKLGSDINIGSLSQLSTVSKTSVVDSINEIAKKATVSPTDFGAKGDGVTDDTSALQLAFNYLRDNKADVLDLNGKQYLISNELLMDGMWKKIIQNGSIKASSNFPTDKYLIQSTTVGSTQPGSYGYKQEDIYFLNLTLDSNFRGGGLSLRTYFRVLLHGCDFRRYSTHGVRTSDSSYEDGHELIITDSFFRGNFKDEVNTTGVAMYITKFDNHFSNIVIVGGKTGIHIKGKYNLFNQVHIYGCTTYGLYSETSHNSFVNMYFDGVNAYFVSPWAITLTNSRFLAGNPNDGFAFIVFDSPSGTNYFSFCNISYNTFEVSQVPAGGCTTFLLKGNFWSDITKHSQNIFTGNASQANISNPLVPNHFFNSLESNRVDINGRIPGKDTTQQFTQVITFNIDPKTGKPFKDGAGIADGVVIETNNRWNYQGNNPDAINVKTTTATGKDDIQTPTTKFTYFKNGDFELVQGNLIGRSADGSRWKLSFNNDGSINTTKL
ncbi:hypothetical protein HSE3_gp096 [Bacillus phage vB_BceM-HSE3]|nr:hypothetical protein HSE3_gp096 [Bacillus phage vB_BceM-HSE3]